MVAQRTVSTGLLVDNLFEDRTKEAARPAPAADILVSMRVSWSPVRHLLGVKVDDGRLGSLDGIRLEISRRGVEDLLADRGRGRE